MLRITEVETCNGDVVLKLEGRIVGPWVGEVEKASEKILDRDQTIKLDLADVSYVDREGVALLLALKGRRVVLDECSAFVLEELREADREAPDSKRQTPKRSKP